MPLTIHTARVQHRSVPGNHVKPSGPGGVYGPLQQFCKDSEDPRVHSSTEILKYEHYAFPEAEHLYLLYWPPIYLHFHHMRRKRQQKACMTTGKYGQIMHEVKKYNKHANKAKFPSAFPMQTFPHMCLHILYSSSVVSPENVDLAVEMFGVSVVFFIPLSTLFLPFIPQCFHEPYHVYPFYHCNRVHPSNISKKPSQCRVVSYRSQ